MSDDGVSALLLASQQVGSGHPTSYVLPKDPGDNFAHGSPDDSESEFELVVVQQPLRARTCGFSDKVGRP
jgi:hypothetical protein